MQTWFTYLLREKSYEPLQNIKSKYGVYGILGNHDHFDGRIQTEVELFRSVGFHMLVDEAVDLPCHIHLVGLEDYRSEPRNPYLEKLAGTDPGKANLLLEHQPRRFWEAEKAGYDLYMAGHTHWITAVKSSATCWASLPAVMVCGGRRCVSAAPRKLL